MGRIAESPRVIDVTETHPADRISEASATMWSAAYVASALVLNLDWHVIRTERAEDGDGQYVAGGWANPSAPVVWDIRLVQTPSIALGGPCSSIRRGCGCSTGSMRR